VRATFRIVRHALRTTLREQRVAYPVAVRIGGRRGASHAGSAVDALAV